MSVAISRVMIHREYARLRQGSLASLTRLFEECQTAAHRALARSKHGSPVFRQFRPPDLHLACRLLAPSRGWGLQLCVFRRNPFRPPALYLTLVALLSNVEGVSALALLKRPPTYQAFLGRFRRKQLVHVLL